MDLQTSKIELAKLILNLDNPDTLLKIKEFIQNQDTTEFGLTAVEKEEIQLALVQLDSGKRISIGDYLNKVS